MPTHRFRAATASAVVVAVAGLAACGPQNRNVAGEPAVPTTGMSQPSSSASGSGMDSALPKHFRIESVGFIHDCRTDGDKVSCTTQSVPMPDNHESWTEEMTGTLSGLTLTGTSTTQEIFHQRDDPKCRTVQRRSGPVTYEFSPDGTVVMSEGRMHYDTKDTGDCPGSGSYTGEQWGGQGTGTWSRVE